MTDIKIYPLTLPQESFYYDYLLNGDNLKYNMGGAFFINGPLDIELYREAYYYAAEHFDAMRIKFVKDGELLYQQFRPEYKCEIEYYDFRNQVNPSEKALEFLLQEYKKSFDPESEILYSEMLLQTGDNSYIVGPKFHHLVNDAMGKSVFNQALSEAYNYNLKHGTFPELKYYSYIDFINDDLQYRESDTYKNSFEFWKKKFANLPEPFSFTSKKKSIKNISQHTERLALNLHRVCFESILNLADETDSTTYQVFLALISITLNKCYNNNEFVIGMPVLNRSNHKFRNTPGLFMNMMALKINIKPGDDFGDLVKLIKSEIREGYRHQRFPLRDTIKHLRSNSEFNNELFDVTVVYRKSDFSQLFGEAKMQSITFDTEIRNESLSIEIDEFDEEGNVNIFFNYNPLVISSDEIAQFVHCFETILMGSVLYPGNKIENIVLLNDFDAYKILHEFNYSPDQVTTGKTIIELFEEIVTRNPDADAVIHNDTVISYKDLNEKANTIANYLLKNYKVLPEEIICLASGRTINAIAAMLGIMKTGAAYLPIDPEHPVERIKYIIENSGAGILIKSGIDNNNLAEYVLDLDKISCNNTASPDVKIHQDNLAYVIFTSGSTGKPKGVMIEHGQFMSMFVNVIDKFGVKETDHVLQFASLGFDASVFEIFQALLTGAVLVIADKEKIRNVELFVSYLDEKKVTVATLPPVYLSVLEKAELPYLHTLVTAGEQAVAADVNYYKQCKRYINGYGPTENSVCSTLYIANNEIEYSGIVPIGKPAPNSKVYILNDSLEPVPVGFEGELCISGPGLARGYLNNKELTEKKFVSNPFDAGTRLYRTGDLARWRQDGNIEFLGRIDDQVKINGNRIELGEIESQLAKYEGIKELVVLDITNGEDKELAAFLTCKKEIDVKELKLFLRKYLPEYMIPAQYIFIDRIPVTQNGKINKAALRKLAAESRTGKTTKQQALSSTEEHLITMFEEILNVHPVGPDDSFFELGGESLKITKLISKIKKELKQEIGFKIIFDNPTVRSIAAELETQSIVSYEDIPAALPKEYYNLSHAQKRLWILAQNKENAAAYHMPVSLLLEGHLDAEALKASLETIIRRHESLRTVFIDINGTPYQKIIAEPVINIGCRDLSGAENNETAQELVKEFILVPFDLTFDIPIRVNIIKLEEDKHILLLVIHHLAGDGISIGIILKELSALYNAFTSGTKYKLPPLRIQYKDYCEYEKEIIESKKYNDEKQYWLNKLQAPLPVLELAYDRSRPPVKTYSGNYLFFNVEDKISTDVIKFCRQQGISLYIFMVTVVNVLLHKYSSQEDIIVGSPVAGRNNPDLENQVGIYLNTVALRNCVNSSARFIDLLHDVKTNSAEAIANSNYPFDRLIQAISTDRDTSRTPLFDVLVQLQTKTELTLNSLSASFYEADFKLNKFDLTFTFVESENDITYSIGYNTDLFNVTRIQNAAQHLNNIIAGVLKHPVHAVKDINLLNDADIENLVKVSSGPVKEFNRKLTIPELFEAQTLKTPGNTALVMGERKISYKELDELANNVANEIKLKCEINPDDVIGIMTSRSELMIIGMLGILKAGAAYLPVDPGYPAERISFMLQDSNAKLLLTENILLNKAGEVVELNKSGIEILDISALKEPAANKPAANIISENLAYVIYTSGSTGKPKGVMIEHSSLYNLVLGLSDAVYGATPGPLNIALIAPFVFDASVKQIFYALLNGHCLDIVPEEIKTNGRKLLEYYEMHRINVSDGTPVHLDILLDELVPGSNVYLPGKFVIGGQQLIYTTIKRLFELRDHNLPVIVNVYGPTECCDVSTCFTVTPDYLLSIGNNYMPIGRPLNNVQVYVLDKNLNPVPAGISGELYIAGCGLARGYINNNKLTEEKYFRTSFIKNERIYRTGDIGHYLDDGNLIITGRADDQVKLRGYRIELNEIENCLRTCDKIKSAAVALVEEENTQEIAAYYCPAGTITPEYLRQFLSLHLPEYMIPAYFVEMEKLPLTINGKVDKKQLPCPEKNTTTETEIQLPADKLEEKLSELWKELLHISRVSLTDNFFKLGGHSLIAIRLTSRIHKEFNIELNIWEIFQHPTILSLAELLRSKHPSLFTPIEKIAESEYYPLSHSQRRLWLISKLEEANVVYNLPAALLLRGAIDIEVFEKAFGAIVQRHESFRTYFVEIDGEPFQKIVPQIDFKIEVSKYQGKEWNDETLKALANEYFLNGFDLSKAPLIQIKIIELPGSSHLLLFNMHHIISDGWSIEVTIREIENYYNAFANNRAAGLQPLRVQYKDYASWQNKILDNESLTPVKEYWQEKLKKPRPLLDLPADYARAESFSDNGNMIRYALDDKIGKALQELGGRQNASLFMTLLSAVYVLLYKYTGEEDIIIGSPVAGRQHYDLENQVGFFINTLALRNEVNPEYTFRELLNMVKITLSGAIDNQVYPFDRLVDELDVDRIRNRNPLFDVMAAWMVKNGMELKLNFNGVEAEALEFTITKSMFDLTFLFSENEGKIVYAIEYNTSLFKQERIERMSLHFKELLNNIIAGPETKIKNLGILPLSEKELLIKKHVPVARIAPVANVIELFKKKSELNKNNTALVYSGKKITYDELNKLSNRIANSIIEQAAPVKDDIISVIVSDPVLAVASMLAVMKTGAAYLPVMPDNPAERVLYIINDSNSKCVITDNIFADITIPVIDLRNPLSNNELLPGIQTEEDSLAYVIYTSGSTGVPKGVMIEHKSLSNLVVSLNNNIYSRYTKPLNELMISTFAFDVSVKQIFAALCNGNALHILNNEARLDPREITKYIVTNRINIADLTPSLFSVMLEEGFAELIKPDLKEIFLGSEALPFKLVKSLYEYKSNHSINVTNFYGPTECCVESSYFRFSPGMVDREYDIAPIGKPVLNEQIFILDKYLNLCPLGVPGEICIAGKGLARQYLNDPERTAEKFVSFPLNGERIYKTGDLGKINSDGNIEFLGRMDEQVKIRGYRVELQEIEKQLRQIEEIKDCAVTLYEKDGVSELAAYFTSDSPINSADLKNKLGRFLPVYMVPAYFVQLDKIPVSSTGKLNKKLLPAPLVIRKKEEDIQPQDEIDIIIMKICSEVLKKSNLVLSDNFFDIGGHSLNAVRVISRIQKELDIELALKEIFYTPVLKDISGKVKKIIADKDSLKITVEEDAIIVPISDDELQLLSNLQFDDEE